MRVRTNSYRLGPVVIIAVWLACLDGAAHSAPEMPEPQTHAILVNGEESHIHNRTNHSLILGPVSAPPRQRPRTLAAAREQSNHLPGQDMDHGGAVDFGKMTVETYDAAFVIAVQQHWHNLLERTQAMPRPGKVVLDFNLNSDGRVSDMKSTFCEVGPLLEAICQAAVLDPAPYTPWPADWSRAMGATQRRVTISFCSLNEDFGPSRFVVRPPHAHLICELRRHPRTIVQHVSPGSDSGRDDSGYVALPVFWPLDCGRGPYSDRPFDYKCIEKDLRQHWERDLQSWRNSLPRCPTSNAVPK